MKHHWPKYAHFYNYLHYAIRWQIEDTYIKTEVYCPDSNIKTGVCMSIIENLQSVYLFSFEESKHILEEILHFVAIRDGIQDILDNFLNSDAKLKGMKHYQKEGFTCYLKAKEDCLKIIVDIPEDCILKSITEEHIPLINSHWHYHDIENSEKSIRYLKTLIKINASYGLYLKKNNSLVCWVLLCHRGCLAVLNTLEEHRKKGYAKIVTLAITKFVAEKDNVDVAVYVDDYNVTAARFFESMQFKKVAALATYDVNK